MIPQYFWSKGFVVCYFWLIKTTNWETYNDPGDRFYEIKLETIKSERLSSLEAAEKIDQNKKKLREKQHYMIMSIEKTRH